MALTDKLTAIGNAIRAKSGKTGKLSLDQMPMEIADIQTGVELNFTVVGNPQPENPGENTIWVNTDVISGWVFDTEQPEVASEGMVWFHIDRSGPVSFNALGENNITVYPTSAKQYVGGAWVNKPAMIRRNGEWSEFATWLYINGNECEELTGGWSVRGLAWSSSQTSKATMTKTNEENRMAITASAGGIVSGCGEIVKDFDLTNFSTLTIDYELSGNSFIVSLRAIARTAKYLSDSVKDVPLGGNGGIVSTPRQTVSLDVSDLTGLYDLVIAFNTGWTESKELTAYVYSLRAD